MHVIIIGAGLGGLTLAQTFRKQGISYEIFERDEDQNGRFQGWAIAMHTYVPTQEFCSVGLKVLLIYWISASSMSC